VGGIFEKVIENEKPYQENEAAEVYEKLFKTV